MVKSELLANIKSLAGIMAKSNDPTVRTKGFSEICDIIAEELGTCPKCGTVNNGGKFCMECGQDLNKEASSDVDIVSTDYLVVREFDYKEPLILSIHNDIPSAIEGVKRCLTNNTNCSLLKRELSRVKLT